MASRTLSVALRAVVQGYTAPMAQAAAATGSLEASLLRVQRAGAGTAQVGDALTRRVSLPIALVGAAATKMAMDLDQSFAQMRGLAGVAAGEIDGLKESVLDLAGETGRAPQELAEALYFVRSSGIDGKEALDALEVSAKAAASGLGSTQVVADAVTSAMNAYAASGMTAARATDVLVATAREGKAEPAELAAQMGRLLPVASQLGISFEDVGAAVATLSLSGNDAATSTTQLSNVMAKLLKPSQQAAAQLEAVGLSTEKIKELIAERGLLGTLEELRNRLGESGYVKFLEDQQAVQGGLALLGGDLQATRDRFEALNNSVGASADAFRESDSDARSLQQAWATIQVTLIRVGAVLAPFVADVASLVGVVGELPDGVLTAAVALGLFAAALGPVLSIGGRVATMVASLATAVTNAVMPAGALSGAFNQTATSSASAAGGIASAATAVSVLLPLAVGAGIALNAYTRTKQEAARITDLYVDALGREADAQEAATDAVSAAELTAGDLGSKLRDAGADLDVFNRAIRSSGQEIEDLDDHLDVIRDIGLEEALDRGVVASSSLTDELMRLNGEMSGGEMSDLINRLDGLSDRYDDASEAAANTEFAERELSSQHGDTAESVGGVEDAYAEATSALKDYADALRAQLDPMFAAVSASQALADANAEVTGKEMELAAAIFEHGEGSLEAMAAEEELTRARGDAAKAAFDQEIALAGLVDMVREQPGALDAAKAKLQEWVTQGFITQETADATAAKFDEVTGAANNIPAIKSTVITAHDEASGVIRVVQERIDALTGKTIFINAVASYPVPGYQTFGGRQAGGGVVPRYYGSGGVNWDWGMGPRGTDTVPAWLTPGEMILNAGQQAALFRLLQAGPMTAAGPAGFGGAGGRGARVSIDLSGADHFFMDWLRKRIRVQHGGNVQAALGFSR